MLSRLIVNRRWWVIGAWMVITVLLAPFAARVQRDFDVVATVDNSEAGAVDEAMTKVFASRFAQYAVLVVTGVPSPDTDVGRGILRRLTARVDSVPGVLGTLSYLTARDSVFRGRSAGGVTGTFVIAGLDPAARRQDVVIQRLRETTASLVPGLTKDNPALTLRWTGSTVINYDIRVSAARESSRAEQRVAPLTLLLLFIAFGAVVAACLPLVAAAVAIIVALGLAAMINRVMPLSILLANITSMIGLGVGIDYALLTVSRFREARSSGMSVENAAADASHHAGATIALSGAAVCIGFGSLVLIPVNEVRSIGVGGVLVVFTSVLVAASLLPALLAVLGSRIEVGRLKPGATRRRGGDGWRRWGEIVVRRPATVLVVSAIPLAILTWQARRLDARLPRGNWLPRGIESGLAIGDLVRLDRGGVVNSVRLLVELPANANLLTANGWQMVKRLSARLESDRRIARVVSITTALPLDSLTLNAYGLLPVSVRNAAMSPDARTTIIEAMPRSTTDLTAVVALVRELRGLDLREVGAPPGVRVRIGGVPGLNVDYEDAISSRTLRTIGAVVGLTLLALMVGFRSILIPIKSVALNLVSVGTAFGAVVLVFQDGHGAKLVGLDGPVHGVFPALPILVFCIVFGLSMDYEIFLVSRVAEARRTMDEPSAVVEGLARTGGVITNAAAVMIVVFAAFSLGQFQFIKILGFALAVAVFVDATLVRMAIGPALFVLAGKWNWWPGDSRRELTRG